MATGSGVPGVTPAVSDITPGYNTNNGSSLVADAVSNAGKAADNLIDAGLRQHAEDVGAKQGAAVAAGTAKWKNISTFTDVGQAREAAANTAYLTGTRTAGDQLLDDAHRANQYDPAGFKAASDKIVAGLVKGAPPHLAVQVEAYAKGRAGDALNVISNQRLQRDDLTAVNSMAARQSLLTDKLETLAGNGGEASPEYAAARAEYAHNSALKVQNPLYAFAPEQAALDEAKLTDKLQGAAMTFHTLQAYKDAGGGEPGLLAAKTFTDLEISDHPQALAGIELPKRLALVTAALKGLHEADAADAQSRSIKRQDQANNFGTMSEDLALHRITEADVLNAGDKLAPGQAARLIDGVHAQQNHDAAEARRGAAEERSASSAARRENYEAAIDLDNNGQLNAATLRQVGAGLLPSQVSVLRGRLSKAAKPVISQVMGIITGTDRDEGITGGPQALQRGFARAEVSEWALENPHAGPHVISFYAHEIGKKYGINTPTNPYPKAANLNITRAQSDAIVRKRFTGGQVPAQSDLDRNWRMLQAAKTNH